MSSLPFRCFSLFLPHFRTLAQEERSENCLRFETSGPSLCLYPLLSRNIIFLPALTIAARAKKEILVKRFAHAISVHYRDFEHAYVYWIWLRGSASYVIINLRRGGRGVGGVYTVCHPQKVFFQRFWRRFTPKGLKVSVAVASFSIKSVLCPSFMMLPWQPSNFMYNNQLLWNNSVFFPVFFIKLQEFKTLYQQWFQLTEQAQSYLINVNLFWWNRKLTLQCKFKC